MRIGALHVADGPNRAVAREATDIARDRAGAVARVDEIEATTPDGAGRAATSGSPHRAGGCCSS